MRRFHDIIFRILTKNSRFYVCIVVIYSVVLSLQGQSSNITDNYQFAHLKMQDGLSNNNIQCILRDSRGFLWIGTRSGLNRYDGFHFKIYTRQPFDSLSLIDNSIENLYEDHLGNIWVNTPSGFCIYNPADDKFARNYTLNFTGINISIGNMELIYKDNVDNIWCITKKNEIIKYNYAANSSKQFRNDTTNLKSINNSPIADIKQDTLGSYWLIHRNGCLEKMNPNSFEIDFRTFVTPRTLEQVNYDFSIFIDQENDLWIYTTATSLGLIQYKTATNEIVYWKKENKDNSLNSDIIGSVIQDNNGKIWVGTDHGGINIIDKTNSTTKYLLHNPENEKSIGQNSITSLYKDSDGIIWVGTFKQGLDYYHEKLFVFDLYTNIPSDPNSIKFTDVNCFCEDEKQNLYIGTNGGGLVYFDRQTNKFSAFKHDPNNPNSLSNDIVVSLYRDKKNRIWIGTYYGGLNVYDGKNFKHYFHDVTNPRSISDNRIWEIFEDSRKNLWIGTLGGGLDLYDHRHDVFHHYSGDDITSIQSNYILSIGEDSNGDLWVGTDNGIFKMEWKSGKVRHLSHSETDYASLSNNIVTGIIEDKLGTMWIGTRDGLNIYNKSDYSFIKLFTENGLPDNNIQSILEDDQSNIWISTSNGLSRISPMYDSLGHLIHFNFLNFDESDGLQDRSFNESADYKTSNGEIIFGGPKGFNLFLPEDVEKINKKPPIYIVDFELLGEPLEISTNIEKKSILKRSIIHTDKLVLNYHENFFAIEFAALEFINAEKVKYRYKLEGFNDNWLYANYQNRKVTFTNLDPGQYTFKVQTYQNILDTDVNEAQLSLIIKPPLYRSKLAFVIYIFVLAATLILFRQMLVFRERLKFQNQQVLLETQRQQELSTIKTRFFTNVSHEFRTPLTLIITPLERILNSSPGKEEIQTTLKLIYQNARRLLGLVNQLLDFRKMEEQRLSLNLDYGNVINYLEDIYKSFHDLAESKNIHFEFKSSIPELFMRFDADKLEKILFNLLSNAFKFTHDGDSIMVEIMVIDKDSKDDILNKGTDTLLIKVEDTGIGIPNKKQERIFERFFQYEQPTGSMGKGSGIGLSLTKEFVKLHRGKISVRSEVDKGSTFYVYLPINRERIEKPLTQTTTIVPVLADESQDLSKTAIMLVEDNEDFRFYLRDNLKLKYRILEAGNGKEAFNLVMENMPDLIVSDLKMPEMNGIKLCEKIKNDKKTSHIPFLLLTASQTEESKIEAFQSGADAYITKPFSFEILESRIKNLIAQREKTKMHYQKNFEIEPGTIGITPLDEKLMNKALKLVEENIADPEFTVEKLSSKLGFSRVHLYKKMMSITGKTPVEFIRLVRLKRAAQLLRESQLTVSEIAYQVGFNDPRYFSKQFKLEFNMLPSKYKEGYSR